MVPGLFCVCLSRVRLFGSICDIGSCRCSSLCLMIGGVDQGDLLLRVWRAMNRQNELLRMRERVLRQVEEALTKHRRGLEECWNPVQYWTVNYAHLVVMEQSLQEYNDKNAVDAVMEDGPWEEWRSLTSQL